MEQGKGLQLLEERLTSKLTEGSDAVGFDPLTILTIITALIPLIQGCFNANPKALRRRLFNRSRVATSIRKEAPQIGWAESLRMTDKIFDLADSARDEELQALINDCCSGGR